MKHEDPLDIINYIIGVLPPIKRLKVAYPDVTQPCYSDDAGSMGAFYNLELYFNSLKHNGPLRGNYPKPTKSVITVHPENPGAGKRFGAHHRLTLFMGTRFLRGYIRDDESKCD